MASQIRRWAHDQEEQEEFLADPILARFREVLLSDLQAQRHRLMGKCRTGSLEEIRFEMGMVTALEDIVREIEEDDV